MGHKSYYLLHKVIVMCECSRNAGPGGGGALHTVEFRLFIFSSIYSVPDTGPRALLGATSLKLHTNTLGRHDEDEPHFTERETEIQRLAFSNFHS
jgi:hypothetical protein